MLTDKEKQLISNLLDIAGDEFSNHSCTDVPDKWFENWVEKEKQELAFAIEVWNGSPEDYDSENIYFDNWILMNYFSYKIKEE